MSHTEATLSWDVSGYYLYLPAIFIYKDLRQLEFRHDILKRYLPTPEFQQGFLHQTSGNYVLKYPCGQAITMLPFFLVAHAIATFSVDTQADGFSYPYQICIGVGMLIYSIIGLYLMYKLLKRYYNDITVAIVLVGLILGTNYLNYVAIDQAMTHSTLFTLYLLIIHLSIRFYRKPGIGKAVLIGTLLGLAVLIRPTEIIVAVIPMLWGVQNLNDLRNRMRFFKEHAALIIAAIVAVVLIACIQIIYWKYVSGEWIVYSYQDQGFSWLRPHVGQFTFSYCCGWLRYSPMLIFAILGIIPFVLYGKNRLAVIGFLVLNFYVVTAWDLWDYGGMSGRAMVQSYPLWMLPFASLITYVNSRRVLPWIFYPLFLLCIYLNIWWTHNAHRGKVPVFTWATKAYYWNVVGKWKIDEMTMALLDNKYLYQGNPHDYSVLYTNDFETDSSANSIQHGIQGKSIRLSEELQFTDEYRIDISHIEDAWLRVSADFRCAHKEWEVWKQAQFIVKCYDDNHAHSTHFIRVYRFLTGGETRRLHVDVRRTASRCNTIGISFWNAGSDKILEIDNLQVIHFPG